MIYLIRLIVLIYHKKIRKLDSNRCRSCGSYWNLNVHHVVYRSLGGNDRIENLMTVCVKCHRLIHSFRINILSLLKKLSKRKDFRWNNALIFWEKQNEE